LLPEISDILKSLIESRNFAPVLKMVALKSQIYNILSGFKNKAPAIIVVG
jgi:hypothetical protein